MDLSSLLIRNVEERFGSLALSLVSLLRWAGGNVHHRDVNAALGLSLRTVAVRGAVSPGWWPTYGSDRFLVEAAAMWGVRLRPLHPPEAAVGLDQSEAFDQHFEASYSPLIRDALEHGQPVLAWQGWPDARASLWGIITQSSPEGLGFSGTTMWSRGQDVPLVRPALQLYVVEEIDLRRPSHEELFQAAVGRFRVLLQEPQAVDPNVVLGSAAYDLWLEHLEHPVDGVSDDDGRGHVHYARCLTADRSAGIRFFRHYRDGSEGESRHLIDAILAECRGEVDVLGTLRDNRDVRLLIESAEGRRALTAGVRAAQSFERAMAAAVNALSAQVGRTP
jgi:hypothetical protein